MVVACIVSTPVHAQVAATTFVPEQVFSGKSAGTGTMRLGLGRQRPFTVASVGTAGPDGSLTLEQQIHFEGKPGQSRSWVMRHSPSGLYSATLTEAAGPVHIHSEGKRLSLRYPLNRWGLVMHQTLDLSRDGRTVLNSGSIRFLGIPIGRVRETIRLQQ